MSTFLYDLTVIYYQNLICMFNRSQTVGNNNYRFSYS